MSDEILDSLAQRLSELRQQLEQVRRDLSRGEIGERDLRCHTCGRQRATDQAGWTLRLCADDELHAFCPDCDHRHLHRNRPDERTTQSSPQGMHGLSVPVGNSAASDAGLPL